MDGQTTHNDTVDKYQGIPAVLRGLNQWVCFKLEPDPKRDKPRKVPYMPKAGAASEHVKAKANDPQTWGSFDAAVEAVRAGGYDGIGFEFGSGVFGVDLDHVLTPDGKLTPKARYIVDTLDSYTEISPSGTGVHVLCIGSIPDGERRRDEVEMYSTGRFFTVTGNTFEHLRDIKDRTAEAAIIHESFIKKHEPAAQGQPTASRPQSSISMTDRDIYDKMVHSKNGVEIERLYRGDWQGRYNSQSEADQALCNYLAWWTNGDTARIDNLFRASGLMRPKWDERHGAKTYGVKTIETAVSGTSGGYDPAAARQQEQQHGSTPQPPDAEDVPDRVRDYTGDDAAPEEFESYEPEEAPRLPGAVELMPTSLYMHGGFIQDIADHIKYQNRKTGFANLDAEQGGLYSGLYVLGATPSLGKTTLMLQMCDQLAKAGEHCIYFALEQSRFELVSKSLSRITGQLDRCNALTANNIKNGYQSELLEKAKDKYSDTAGNITFVDGAGAFETTITNITATVQQAIKDFGRKPVVFIDYLQIIQVDDARLTGKDKIDEVTKQLKRLQSKNDLLMFVISSFNRANYAIPVDFESFKESGGIEYTADVLWGLQLQCLHEDIFDQANKVKEKREVIRQAKQETPRHIELVCLKNRYGRLYNAAFNYDTAVDTFIPGTGDIDDYMDVAAIMNNGAKK